MRLRWGLLVLGCAVSASAFTPDVDYAVSCQGCHRADGTGTPGSVPALAGSVAKLLHVRGGREFLCQVPGVAQSVLDDPALAAVLNWMLDHFDQAHMPASFAPYTGDEVGRLRRRPLTDVEQARRALVRAIEQHK